MIRKEKHPNGCIIVYEDDKHIYYEEGKEDIIFTSATQIEKKYKIPFDKETISKRYAKKHGLNRKHVLATWDKKGEDAVYLGNNCHNYSYSIATGEDVKVDNRFKNYYGHIRKEFKSEFLKSDEIRAEYIIASPKYKKAGTIDLLHRRMNHVFIIDWKTNNTIDDTNNFQKLLYPFERMDDCKLNLYTIQLNIYRYILQIENYFPNCIYSMWIKHLKEYGIINIPIEKIDDSIMKKVVESG